MTKEDYVSFEVAKLLKEKGYKGFTSKTLCGEYNDTTLYDAQKWLREEYKLFISIIYNPHDDGCYEYRIYKIGTDDIYHGDDYGNKYFSYEEALNEGIKEALKMI